MEKESKIKLLREIERQAGLEKFTVNVNSSHEDIDNALNFCITTINILESYEDKINEALNDEDEDLNYSIKDETTNYN